MNTAVMREPASSPVATSMADPEFYEIIDGELRRLPPMGILAIWIANEICHHLNVFARTNGIGRALAEALFHMPSPISRDRRPDVAFVSYLRWPKSRMIPRTDNAWNVVPDLAVEVVSPTDNAEELQEKIGEYFRAGVTLVWVFYPLSSQVFVYQSPTQIHVLTPADDLDGGTVLPGFRLSLAEIFSEQPQNGPAS